MIKALKRVSFLLALCVLTATNSFAKIDPNVDYLVSHSQHFSIYHTKQQSQIAQKVANYAEAIYPQLQKKLNWTPTATTHIVLDDGNDFSNGFASVLRQNHVTLFLTPPLTINTLENTNNFLYSLIKHELTHTFHLEKNKGLPALLGKVIGRNLFAYPNHFTPSWIVEGLATHYETDHKQHIGRGASAAYDNLFRGEYLNGFKAFDQINLNIRTLPAGTTRYLYGVFFIEYLARTYGDKKITQWVENYSDNIIPFQIHSNAKDVFGKDLFALYDDFIKERTAFYKKQIKHLKQQPLSKTKRLSTQPIKPDFVVNNETIFAITQDYASANTLIQLDKQFNVKELMVLRGNAVLNQATQSHIIITKIEKCNEYTNYYDIYRYHIKNKSLTQITHCGRYPYAVELNNRQFIAVQLNNGVTRLQLLDNGGKLISEIKHTNNNARFGKIALNPNGQTIAVNIYQANTGWQIEQYHLARQQWSGALKNKHSNFYPAFSKAGDILYSANKNGVYNIYKSKKAQSHLLLGGLNPVAFNDGLLYSAFSKGKYFLTALPKTGKTVAYMDVGTHNCLEHYACDPLPIALPMYLSAKQATSNSLDGNTSTFKPFKNVPTTRLFKAKPYSAIESLTPYSWFPSIQSGAGLSQFGLTVNGADVLERHQYNATVKFDTKYKKLSGNLQYQLHQNWSFLLLRQLGEIAFNNNIYLRKQDVIGINYTLPKTQVESAHFWVLGGSYAQNNYQKTAASAPSLLSNNSKNIGLGYIISNAQNYLLAYNTSEGQTLRATVEYAKESFLTNPSIRLGLDWRYNIALNNQQVLSTRLVVASSENNNIYSLGGNASSSNFSVLNGGISEPLFNKTNFPLRGYANTGFGSALAVASLEWRIPLNRPETGLSILPVASLQNSYNLFVDVGTLYKSNATNNVKTGIGVELINKVALVYHVELSLRTGLAFGLNTGGDSQFYFALQQQF